MVIPLKIIFSKPHLGSEIVKAFSDITIKLLSYVFEYKTRVLTKMEVFEEDFGIMPSNVKIEIMSPILSSNSFGKYKVLIIIDDITLTDKYHTIYMGVSYIYNNSAVVNIKLIKEEGLTATIEAIINQATKKLNQKT